MAHLAACAYYYLYFEIYLATHLPCSAAQRDDESVSECDPQPRLRLRLRLQLGFGCAQLRMLPPLLLPLPLPTTSCHLVALAKSVAHVAACHFRICGQKSQQNKDFFLYIYIFVTAAWKAYFWPATVESAAAAANNNNNGKNNDNDSNNNGNKSQSLPLPSCGSLFLLLQLLLFFFCIWPLALTRQNHKEVATRQQSPLESERQLLSISAFNLQQQQLLQNSPIRPRTRTRPRPQLAFIQRGNLCYCLCLCPCLCLSLSLSG